MFKKLVADYDLAISEIKALELEKSDLIENAKDRADFEKIGAELEFAQLQKARAEKALKNQITKFTDNQIAGLAARVKSFNQRRTGQWREGATALQTAISCFSEAEFSLVRGYLSKAKIELIRSLEVTKAQRAAIEEGFAEAVELKPIPDFVAEKQNLNQLVELQKNPGNRPIYEKRLFGRLLRHDFFEEV